MDFARLVDAGGGAARGMDSKADTAIRSEVLSPDPTRKMVSGVRFNIHHRASRFQIFIVFTIKGEPERLRA